MKRLGDPSLRRLSDSSMKLRRATALDRFIDLSMPAGLLVLHAADQRKSFNSHSDEESYQLIDKALKSSSSMNTNRLSFIDRASIKATKQYGDVSTK
jgi:hypothetical protein